MDAPSHDSLKKTKIVATLGPSTNTEEAIKHLGMHGLNVARLNFSHGTHDEHQHRLDIVRKVAKELNKPIAIMQDLQGPRIRLGALADEPQMLTKGQEVTLVLGKEQTDDRIPVAFDMFPYLKVGDRVLIRDGLIRLSVEKVHKDHAECIVRVGGEIGSRKGINLPDTKLPSISFTEKDAEDLVFGLKNKVDYVALSFVQDAEDIHRLRATIAKHDHRPKIVAKIECQEAIRNLKSIIEATDVVMVARGDMATEVGQEDVPIIQREIIRLCRATHTPVIVATQMLESMIKNPVPTRAEVNDIASAVMDHADACMLSGETANGDYPTEAISTMERIIKRVERHHRETLTDFALTTLEESEEQTTAIAAATTILAHQLKAEMIVVATTTGKTAQRIASYRPPVTVAAITDNELTYNQLAMVYGVKSFLTHKLTKNEEGLNHIVSQMKEMGYVKAGDKIVHVTGEKPGEVGGTSMIKVELIK